MSSEIVGAGTAIILAILASSWALATRLARVETKVENIGADVAELKTKAFRK